MAQLKDTVVQGSLRVTDTTYTNNLTASGTINDLLITSGTTNTSIAPLAGKNLTIQSENNLYLRAVQNASVIFYKGDSQTGRFNTNGNLILGTSSTNAESEKLYVYGKVKIDDTTVSSSTSTGALAIGGGAGIGGKLYVGSDTNIAGHLYLASNKGIHMNYNSTNYDILHNFNNGNVGLSAAGSGLYIGYYITTTTHMYYSSSTSSRTEFFTINNNGSYAQTRFGVNGQNTSYTFYVNGTSQLNGNTNIVGDLTLDGDNIFDLIYPIGAIYISTVNTSPATLFGGTWEQISDKFLLAAGTIYAAGTTSGAASHTLAVSELPAHSHGIDTHTHSIGTHAHGIGTHTHGIGTHTHSIATHNHTLNSHTHGVGTYAAVSNGAHTHGLYGANTTTNNSVGNSSYVSHGWIPNLGGQNYGTINSVIASNGAHGHTISGASGAATGNTGNGGPTVTGGGGNTVTNGGGNTTTNGGGTTTTDGGGTTTTNDTGSGTAFSIMPPYLTVYVWKRIA